LDIDDHLSLGQAGLQASVLAAQQGQFLGQRVWWGWFGTAWLWSERLELASCTQPSPFDQMGRVQAFTAE
jgi:hypothetical protein